MGAIEDLYEESERYRATLERINEIVRGIPLFASDEQIKDAMRQIAEILEEAGFH